MRVYLIECAAFLVPAVIIIAMWLLIRRSLKLKRHRESKAGVHQRELYELKKKILKLHQAHEKLVHNLQLQVHQLKTQLNHLNEHQILDLKEREGCIAELTKEKALLEGEVEALRLSLRALDFRA